MSIGLNVQQMATASISRRTLLLFDRIDKRPIQQLVDNEDLTDNIRVQVMVPKEDPWSLSEQTIIRSSFKGVLASLSLRVTFKNPTTFSTLEGRASGCFSA